MLRPLLPLALAALLLLSTAVPSLSLTARLPDGTLRSWDLLDITPYRDPSSGNTTSLVYALDRDGSVLTLDGTTGNPTKRSAPLTGNVDGWSSIAANGAVKRVYAVGGLYGDSYNNFSLAILTNDLQPVATIPLNTVLSPLQRGDQLLTKPLIDTKGNLLFVRQLANGTVLVSSLTQDGKLVSTWTPALPPLTTVSRYTVGMGGDDQLHFVPNTFRLTPSLATVYVTAESSGALLRTLTLNVTECSRYYSIFGIEAIAVSHSGLIAVSSDNCVLLYAASGVRVPSFHYTAQSVAFYTSLVFDSNARLLAVNNYIPSGVLVISSVSGNTVNQWSDGGIPTLQASVNRIYLEQNSQSLLVVRRDSVVPAVQLDVERGTLIQQYGLIGRLSGCFPFASDVGSMTGDIWMLLRCEYVNRDYRVVLHSMNRVGQTKRQVDMQQWTWGRLQAGSLLVAEDLGLFYVISNTPPVNRVMVFTFNGTNVFNFSDTRIGSLTSRILQSAGIVYPQLVRVNNTQFTLAVTDPGNGRIALLDIVTGGFFGNITLPNGNTVIATACHDGEFWYRSETVVPANPFGPVNASVKQYAQDGTVVAEFVQDNNNVAGTISTLSFDAARRRLYAASPLYGMIAWWDVLQAGQQSAGQSGEKRVVYASVVRSIREKREQSISQNKQHSGERRDGRWQPVSSIIAAVDERAEPVVLVNVQ